MWSLWQCIREGKLEDVEEWLREYSHQVTNKDIHGFAPVHYAAKFNQPEIMQKLVSEGAGRRC